MANSIPVLGPSGRGNRRNLLGWQKLMFLGSNMFLGNDFQFRFLKYHVATVSLDHWMVATKMWTSSLVCRGRQTTARGGCNVRQSALQKFLKISIKNSKCAVSNKHIQDGRPGRYENRRGSKIKAKHHQKTRPHHPGTRMSEMSSPRRRENQEFCHLTAKRQGFGRKVPNETIVPRRWGMMPEAGSRWSPPKCNCILYWGLSPPVLTVYRVFG